MTRPTLGYLGLLGLLVLLAIGGFQAVRGDSDQSCAQTCTACPTEQACTRGAAKSDCVWSGKSCLKAGTGTPASPPPSPPVVPANPPPSLPTVPASPPPTPVVPCTVCDDYTGSCAGCSTSSDGCVITCSGGCQYSDGGPQAGIYGPSTTLDVRANGGTCFVQNANSVLVCSRTTCP